MYCDNCRSSEKDWNVEGSIFSKPKAISGVPHWWDGTPNGIFQLTMTNLSLKIDYWPTLLLIYYQSRRPFLGYEMTTDLKSIKHEWSKSQRDNLYWKIKDQIWKASSSEKADECLLRNQYWLGQQKKWRFYRG